MRRALSEVKQESQQEFPQGMGGHSGSRQHHSSLLDDDEESQSMLRVLKVGLDFNQTRA
jgi:hypothetical protein